jgi:hypothetical protein
MTLQQEAIERAGGRCEQCGQERRLVAHHKRYGSDLTLDDFLAVCSSCHTTIHHQPGAPSRPANGRNPKTSESIRLTPEAKRLMKAMASMLGVSASSVMELALRTLAREWHVKEDES